MLRRKALVALLVFLASGPLALHAQPAQHEVVVLAFGDSLTQGYGLPPDAGFVARLQAWLDARGLGARVINGGVSGETTAGGAARIGWSLTDEIDAMILTLGGNDMLRGLDPEAARANLSVILDAARERGVKVLLVGMPVPGNYGPAYKDAFERLYPELAAEYGALYFDNFFKGLGELDARAAREFLQPDGIHPNAKGVAHIVAALGPSVAELVERARQGD